MELSLREALQLGHNYIGTEHLLLAIVREGEGIAANILIDLTPGPVEVRRVIIETLTGSFTPSSASDEAALVQKARAFTDAHSRLVRKRAEIKQVEDDLGALQKELAKDQQAYEVSRQALLDCAGGDDQ